MFAPFTPEPDECGYFYHPDLPYDETFDIRECCKDHGLEYHMVPMEGDASEEVEAEYFEKGEPAAALKWTPTPPEGDNWLLIAKYDTEDGPYALFVRPLKASV